VEQKSCRTFAAALNKRTNKTKKVKLKLREAKNINEKIDTKIIKSKNRMKSLILAQDER
jgi:hypothetical protein